MAKTEDVAFAIISAAGRPAAGISVKQRNASRMPTSISSKRTNSRQRNCCKKKPAANSRARSTS